jgi:hypothetical protein
MDTSYCRWALRQLARQVRGIAWSFAQTPLGTGSESPHGDEFPAAWFLTSAEDLYQNR